LLPGVRPAVRCGGRRGRILGEQIQPGRIRVRWRRGWVCTTSSVPHACSAPRPQSRRSPIPTSWPRSRTSSSTPRAPALATCVGATLCKPATTSRSRTRSSWRSPHHGGSKIAPPLPPAVRDPVGAADAADLARRFDNHQTVTGGRNCGAVRFEVSAPLVAASGCHRLRCYLRRSGAAASPSAHPGPDTFGSSRASTAARWKPDGGGDKRLCGLRLVARWTQHQPRRSDRDPGGHLLRPHWIRPSRQFVGYAARSKPIADDGWCCMLRVETTSNGTRAILLALARQAGV
jgi:hypothetical protein